MPTLVNSRLNDLLHSLRLAVRQLRSSPGFALTAILTLALGIGATTAIFTLVYDVMLRPLPYAHPEQLVTMSEKVAEFRDLYPTLPVNANHFLTWERNNRSFQAMALLSEYHLPLGTGDRPVEATVLSATPGVFSVFDVKPRLGRGFNTQEGTRGHDRVVVLMDTIWRQQFHSDPAVLGRTLTLDGYPYTIIGVMPESFHAPHIQSSMSATPDRPSAVQVLIPMSFSPETLQDIMGDFNYVGIGRLRPGISAAQANAEIDALQHAISIGLPADAAGTLSASVTPLQTALVGTNRKPLLLLLAAVGGLLLVACVNTSNLLLARATSRRQQLAIASALGANRANLLGLAMRETTLIAAAGALLGILFAAGIIPFMQRFLPASLDFRGRIHLDLTGALFASALAVLSTLLAAAASAWMVVRTDPQQILHSESRLASQSRSSKRTGRLLVTIEVAVSVVLILATSLLTTAFLRLMKVDRGFETSHTLSATLRLPDKSYREQSARVVFLGELLRRLQQLPGVEAAGVVSKVPLDGDSWGDMIRVPGDNRTFAQLPTEHFRWISPGYFETIHLPLVAGRLLTANDVGKPFVILSELTARTLWPGKDPIGQHFIRAGNTDEPPFTVIGIVKDARTLSLAAADPMMVYVPYWYRTEESTGLVLRTRQDPLSTAGLLRKTISSIDPEVPVPAISTLGGVLADSVATQRFETDLLMLFAISALLLAGLGIYGVITNSVVQREREFGLRLALGAQRANIYRLTLAEGLGPVLLGAGAGLGIAVALTRMTASVFFETGRSLLDRDNAAIVAAALGVLLVTGVVACLLPARRAASTDPMQALRRL